ncbi:MAG: CBS domain-containing protein [Pirellulaceae bacterium]|jgi:CBS domain-containing protein|nr:CBS domain-containing protein [Pirellulaceae bacterium]
MSLLVKRVMTTNVVTIRPEATVDDACAMLLRHHISGLPVVDCDDRLVGIVSERDLLELFSDSKCQSHLISDYMQRNVVTVTEDDQLIDLVDLFVRQRFRRIPVVCGDKLVGIISRRDLIRFTRDLRQRLRGRLDDEKILFRSQQEIANHCGIERSVVQRRLRSGDKPVKTDSGYYRLSKNDLTALFGCA